MLPPVAYCIPLYKMLVRFSLMDNSWPGAGLLHVILPFCVWLIKANIDDIPFELEEAAIIDGAGVWPRLMKVVIPLLLPTLGRWR